MTNEEKMTDEEAREVLSDVSAYLASRASLENEMLAGHTFTDICNAIKVLKQQPCEDMGEVSDGYHTFNQLYHQRAVLFATIVNQNKDKSWKSFKHSDGNYCFDRNGEWFIVGIDTPQGSYTYHYAKEYWNMFDCQELECGKEWDGHTEENVTRLLSLQQQPCDDCVSRLIVQEEITKSIALKENPHQMYKRIQAIPSVTPQPTGWIPCRERMPKKYETVLLTSIWHEVEKAMYIGDGLFDIIINNLQKEEVIAWMPLPQPYGESEDKE